MYKSVAFSDDGLTIRWYDDDTREKHELVGISWQLSNEQGVAVLTMDLGGLAGILKYDLLIDSQYGMLYTMLDALSSITPGQLPLELTLSQSHPAADPMDMLGSWDRTKTLVEGCEEFTQPGQCLIDIYGEEEDGLYISYTDNTNPSFSFQDVAMEIIPGELYTDCGNDQWYAELDYTDDRGMSYQLTLLADGSLVLQRYGTYDGMQYVSYEFFGRCTVQD